MTRTPVRNIQQCPDCSYDLTGLPEPGICPECGFAFDETMRIWWGPRPHRAWGVGALVFFGLLFVLGTCQPVRENLLELTKTHTILAVMLFVSIPVLLALAVRDATRWRYIAVSHHGISIRGRRGRESWKWMDIERLRMTAMNIEFSVRNGGERVSIVLPASPDDRDEVVENMLLFSRGPEVYSEVREADRKRGGNAYAWNTARRIAEYLERDRFPYAVVGGLAVEYYGANRPVGRVEILVQSRQARARAMTLLAVADPDLLADSESVILDRSTGLHCRIWAVGDEIARGIQWEDFAESAHPSKNGLTFANYRAIMEASLALSMSGDATAREDALALIVKLKLPDIVADSLRLEVRTEYLTIGHTAWTAAEPAAAEQALQNSGESGRPNASSTG